MKKILIVPFILFSLATVSSWSNTNDAKIAQSNELSKHRHADQTTHKQHARSHGHKPKSKYDLRDLGGNQNRGSHERGNKHSHNKGDHHDDRAAGKHGSGDNGGHNPGNAHQHDHGDAPESHEDGHSSHDNPGHEEHGHDNGKGHDHGYDRLWGVGVSG